MFILLCCLFGRPAHGFGEAPTVPFRFAPAPLAAAAAPAPAAASVEILSPPSCTLLRPRAAPLRIEVQVALPPPPSSSPRSFDRVCVDVHARHSAQHAWYFMNPPPPTFDQHLQLCGSVADEDVGTARGGSVLLLAGDLPAAATANRTSGHLLLSATVNAASVPHLRLPPRQADAAVVLEIGRTPTPRPALDDAFQMCRDFEADVNRAKLDKFARMSHRFRPPPALAEHLDAALPPREAIAHLLDPRLLTALRNGTVAALSALLGVQPDARTPTAESPPPRVPSFPVLRPTAAALLIDYIDGCKQQNAAAAAGRPDDTLTIPNNFDDDKPRSPWTGVVLDEIGLGPLAEALLLAVVQPLSRVLFPEWGAVLDSYHAFSLHVGTSDGRRQSAVEHRVVGDRLPSHNDICETSINICLGRNFSGSAMQFQNVNGRQGEGTSPPHQQHLEHVPGRAFLNLCQHYHGTNALVSGERHAVVIRGLSSRFRRSPGEEWSAHCPRRGVEPPVFGGDL